MLATLTASSSPDVLFRTATGALRFVDPTNGRAITDGLSVVAQAGGKSVSASSSPRGVYLFHRLPGLNEVSFRDWQEQPQAVPREFVIEVRDALRRFFPVTFKTRFPAWPVAKPLCPGGAAFDAGIPLFSAPWRQQRGDQAAIRGTLRLHPGDKPAAWTLLRAYRTADDPAIAPPLAEGIAGPDGEFLLMFPWPRPDAPQINGPRGAHWTVRLKAWFDLPDPQTVAIDSVPDGEVRLPALCPILKQAPATLLAEAGSSMELPLQEMFTGRTLLVRTSAMKILYLKAS